jgi:hypothetical protein
MKSWTNIDVWSRAVILLTAGLFGLSLLVKGFTHDLFLESAVFLVSVKLILITAKQATSEQRLEMHLKEIKELLARDTTTSTMNTTAARITSHSEENKEP